MKNFIRDKFCKTQEEVALAIIEFRTYHLTIEKCQNYIKKIHEVKFKFELKMLFTLKNEKLYLKR